MADSKAELNGPDLAQGIELSAIPANGMLLGHLDGEAVMLARVGEDVHAIGPSCTHYGGPLNEGLLEGHLVRCPWHHACFDVRTGHAVGAPALNDVPCWKVERRGSRVTLAGRQEPPPPAPPPHSPDSIVIIGAGAAGNAAAEMLRRLGYAGPVTMIGAQISTPVDRPNLSKDYLAGTAPPEWVPLRDEAFYAQQKIELILDTKVESFDPAARQLKLANGATRRYGALLLATGAEPIRLDVPGSEADFVHTLRTLADSNAIIARAKDAKQAVVVGASFIGLEVASALRTRGLEVHVVAPERRPLEKVLGPEFGDWVHAIHEEHGVKFHLGRKLQAIEGASAVLDDGSRLPADLIVVGIGVRPNIGLAERAGLRTDRGVIVNTYLETSAPGVFAAGDIARYPDPHTNAMWRIEHWVVAERQGQAAARNMLGMKQPFADVPFFWSHHYDTTIAYVGHAESWDRIDVAGSMQDRSCVAAFRKGARIDAVASINRDPESLQAESLMAKDDQAGLDALMKQALEAGARA